MSIRTTTSSSTYNPIDFAALQQWGSNPLALRSPLFTPPPQVTEDQFSLDDLPADQQDDLKQFIAANQDKFDGAVDTPQELKKLLQMLHMHEGKNNNLPKLDTKNGQDLANMSPSDMLQALADYLANYAQNNNQRPRDLGNINGGSSRGGGGSGGGGSGPMATNGGGGGGGTSGTSAANAPTGPATNTGSLKGNTNAEKAFNYFISKGLSKEQAAGIVGNLMQESGCNPNSDQDGGPGRGIAQWSEGERWNGVLQLAQQQGKSPNDLGVQLDFLWKELSSTESGSLSALKGTNSAAQAAVTFEEKFERAGTPNNEARVRYANDALAQFA